MYQLSCNEKDGAYNHLRQASLLYSQWGAQAKVEQLDKKYEIDHVIKLK